MNVAVDILPGLGAGVGRWQRETIKALAAAVDRDLVRVTGFSFGTRYPRPDWVPADVAYSVSLLPGRVQRAVTDILRAPVEWVCGLGRTDVVLAMNLHPLRARAPVVLAVADVSWRAFTGQYRTTFGPTQIQQAEQAINRASHILTISKHSADELIRGGVPASRVSIAHLGVDERFRWVGTADAVRVRATYKLPERFVLYVGGINERKNLTVLVDAMQRLGAVVPLVLAGPTPAEPLAFWGLDRPWVRHLSYIPEADVPGLYAAAAVKVIPSKLEGYGLPLVEALATGTPVLAADTPVFREVSEGHAGFFPPDDAAELARLIRSVLDESTDWDKRRAEGRALAVRRNWAAYGQALLSAIRAGLERVQ